MKVLKISLILTVFALCFLVCGFSSLAGNCFENLPPKNNASTNPESLVDKSARELYAQNCARCHGADGRADTELGRTFDVPNIADADWQKKHSNAKISRKIARGGGGMPAFAKKLSPKEIKSLVGYVRALKK